MHSADLLGEVQRAVIDRSGIDPLEVGQVVGGCVGQVGMQAANVTRTAWLQAGLPLEAAATTVNTQCGSSQQATNIATALVAAGVVDVAVACGVEVMSRCRWVRRVPKDPFVGKPINKHYWEHYEYTSQFEGAERIAEKFGVTRDELDAFGKQSQDRAAAAWAEGRFDTQVVPIDAPTLDEDGEPDGTHTVTRDEGLRDTTLEALAKLKPVLDRDPAFHTAGTASQISDGAGAVLLMTAEKADALGLHPPGTIVDTCLVGSDPVLMLTGPIPATQHLLDATGSRSTTSTSSRSTRRSRRSCSAGSAPPAPTWRGQPQRRRHRARPPARRHRRHPAHQGRPRARALRQQPRARHHVLRRRPRHRHHPRTRLRLPRTSRSCRHRRTRTLSFVSAAAASRLA